MNNSIGFGWLGILYLVACVFGGLTSGISYLIYLGSAATWYLVIISVVASVASCIIGFVVVAIILFFLAAGIVYVYQAIPETI